MNNTRHPLSSLLFAVMIIALMAFPISAGASHSWGRYHWARTTTSFTLKLGDNVSDSWDTMLRTASNDPDSNDWSDSSVLDTVVVVPGGTTGITCAPTSGRVEVCSADYGNTNWLGVAQIWITIGSHIAQGTVRNNDFYFKLSQYDTPAWRQLVMCQEIGHTFGLAHQDENFNNANLGTCMDYTSDPDGPPSNENPNQHDYDQLASIYKHKDRFTSVGAAPAGTAPAGWANADVHAQENWGELIGVSANGQESLYMRDFGNGYKIFTFVIWAQE